MAKPAKQKTSLVESDWAALFPTKQYTIGTTVIDITPLSIEELSSILNKLSLISDKIQADDSSSNLDEGVTKSSVVIINLVRIIMEESPDILSDLSSIEVSDIKALPLDAALSLFNFCLDVNIESQESLIKNFNGLAERMTKFMGTKTAPVVQPQPVIQPR